MRATRRTFRTAAVATGAIAALAVPTTAAFAADTPPNPQGQITPDDGTGATDQDQTGQDQTGQDQDKPVPGGWVSKGTTDLGKGWTAKIDVNASTRSAKAEISHDDSVKGSLKAYINPSKTKIDGSTFTLSADGTITRTGAKPQPDGKRAYVRTAKLADGSTAKIYKLGQNHYQADIYAKGVKLDTLDANGKSATGQNNGLHVVLNPDGTIKSWVDGKTGSGSTVVPKGGVKAGAEGVHPAGESTPLIAAGGGMAALGAAGLGFALYRRKQDN
ncbi:hypothetical protein ACWFRJ_28715 [Streptomyces sp. NPDC055239]